MTEFYVSFLIRLSRNCRGSTKVNQRIVLYG
nr:MAG TPA: hypothetical protein [Caudoviricetes sp.]